MAKKIKADTQLLLGAIGGAIGARLVASKIGGLFPANVPASFANVAPIAVGIFLLKSKNSFAKGAAYGMIGSGGARFLGEMIPAIGERSYYGPNRFLNRPANQAILSLPANQAILNQPMRNMSSLKSIVEPKQF